MGLICLLLLVGLVFASKYDRLKLLRGSHSLPPTLIFLFIYGLTLIFMLSYKEHRPLLVDRIQLVILVPLLAVLIELLPTLLAVQRDARARWVKALLLIGFTVWLIYPLTASYRYVSESLRIGDISPYNIHNTREIRESALAQYLEDHPLPPCSRLYSNYNETAWFLTRQQVYGVPTNNKAAGWPMIDGDTYLIWFDLLGLDYMPKTLLTLDEIEDLIRINEVLSGPDGDVYKLSVE